MMVQADDTTVCMMLETRRSELYDDCARARCAVAKHLMASWAVFQSID